MIWDGLSVANQSGIAICAVTPLVWGLAEWLTTRSLCWPQQLIWLNPTTNVDSIAADMQYDSNRSEDVRRQTKLFIDTVLLSFRINVTVLRTDTSLRHWVSLVMMAAVMRSRRTTEWVAMRRSVDNFEVELSQTLFADDWSQSFICFVVFEIQSIQWLIQWSSKNWFIRYAIISAMVWVKKWNQLESACNSTNSRRQSSGIVYCR